MTSTYDYEYPPLNTTLLADLILWAEHDSTPAQEARLRAWIEKHNLGRWNQGIWAAAEARNIDEDTDRANAEEVQADVKAGACETAHCMAGGAVVASGYRMLYDETVDYTLKPHGAPNYSTVPSPVAVTANSCVKSNWVKGPHDKFGHWEDVPGADPVGISEAAQEILGLDDNESDEFFAPENSIRDLKDCVNRFCENRGLPVLYPELINVGA